MTFHYLITPLAAWLGAGCVKFGFYSVKEKRLAFDRNGNGGFPSSHAAIVASVAALIGLEEGIGHPAFGAALALALIVILDAEGLRREVGTQAKAVNELSAAKDRPRHLRERIGHTRVEIGGGVVFGILIATLVHLLG